MATRTATAGSTFVVAMEHSDDVPTNEIGDPRLVRSAGCGAHDVFPFVVASTESLSAEALMDA